MHPCRRSSLTWSSCSPSSGSRRTSSAGRARTSAGARCSAARSSARRSRRRCRPCRPSATCTRCTPTSCGPGDVAQPDRLRRRPHPRRPLVHHAARGRHPERARRSSTWPRRSRSTRPASSTRTRCPTRRAPESLPDRAGARCGPCSRRLPGVLREQAPRRAPVRAAHRRSDRRHLVPAGAARRPSGWCGCAPARRAARRSGAAPLSARLRVRLLVHHDGARCRTASSWLTPGMQVASLDHVMWFHQPFRFDDWLLHVIDSPTAHGARGLVRGRSSPATAASSPPRRRRGSSGRARERVDRREPKFVAAALKFCRFRPMVGWTCAPEDHLETPGEAREASQPLPA